MSNSTTVFDLSPAEKLQLVEDLWDDLHSDPDQIPVPDELIHELDRRRANLQAHPHTALTWAEVVQHIRSRHGR